VHAIEETFSKLARTRIGHLNTEYEDRLARFLRSLQKSGDRRASAGAHCRADTPHLDAGGRGAQTRPRVQRSESTCSVAAGAGDTCHCRDEEVIRMRDICRLGVRADPVREVGCKVSAVLHRTVDSDSFLEVNSNIPSTVFLKFKRAWPTPNLCPLWSTCAAATVWMMFCVYCAG